MKHPKTIQVINILLICCSTQLNAQCPVADAGPDKYYCSTPDPTGEQNLVFIGSTYSRSDLNYNWTPTIGLMDPHSSFVEVNPAMTTQYTLTVSSKNLLANADFEQGNSSINSDYIFQSSFNFTHGVYTIANNPGALYSWWCNTSPQSGSGMMIIDGSTDNQKRVWYQTVNVEQGSEYKFSGYFTNIYAQNGCGDTYDCAPAIVIKVNGVVMFGPQQLPFTGCNSWQNWGFNWVANSSTATIEIYSASSQDQGNDFAIDNLSFALNCAASSDDVTVQVKSGPTARTFPKGQVDLLYVYDGILPFTLKSSSANENQWYFNGAPIAGASSQYYTTVSDQLGSGAYSVSDGGCLSAEVYLNFLPQFPDVDINTPKNYCLGQSGVIRQDAISYPNTIYSWEFSDPNFYVVTGAPNEGTLYVPSSVINPFVTGVTAKAESAFYSRYIYYGITVNACRLANKSLAVYPNPAQNMLNIEGYTGQLRSLQIYAMDGRLMKNIYVNDKNGIKRIDISYLKTGNYILRIVTTDVIASKAFTVVK